MSDLRTYLGIYVRGDAPQKAREIDGAFQRLGERTGRHLGMLGRGLGVASQGLDRLTNRYTALITGAAGAGALKMVSDLDTRLTYLGIQADKSALQIDLLKNKVFEVANAPDIRVDASQILDAMDSIIEKTGNFEVAEQNIRNIGLAIRATNAQGADIGAMIADLNEKFGLTASEDFLSTLDALTNQGKAGAFTLQNLATQGERVTAAYGAMGRTGPQAVREMGAMLQMIKKGTGSPQQAATAFEALLRTLNDVEKVKLLKRAGIRLTDPEDPKRMRSIVDIFKEIISKSGGDLLKISSIFDAEAIRGFTAAVTEYKKTGGFEALETFLNVAGDGKTIMEDSARAAGTFGASMQFLRTEGERFADANLAGPVQELAGAINSLEPETIQKTIKALAWGGAALGGLIAVNQVAGGVRAAAGVWRTIRGGRGRGAAAAAGGLAGAGGIGAPVPVVVLNWPSGPASAWAPGMGAGAAGGTPAKAGGRLAGLTRRAGSWLGKLGGRALLPLALLDGGIDMAGSLMAGDRSGAAGAGGRMAGGLAGAMGGAALGSVVPGVGTAIGGLAGGLLGALGGESLLRAIAEWLQSDKANGKTDVGVEATVRFENPPPGMRVTSLRSDQPGAELNLDVGPMMMMP